MKCHEALRDLLRAVDEGRQADGEVRVHILHCDACRDLMAGFESEPDAANAASIAEAAEKEVARTHRRDLATRIGVAVIAMAIVSAILLVRSRSFALKTPELLMVGIVAAVLASVVGIPVLALLRVIEGRPREINRRVFKRLGPGRWLSGVCLGIAQTTGYNVWLVRLIFVLLLWFHGAGLLVYLVCDLAMPVHPADREFLLRFRLRRALRWIREAGLPRV